MKPSMLTVPQIADDWQCSRSHLYNEIRAGRLRAYKTGRLMRVDQADYEAWKQAQVTT